MKRRLLSSTRMALQRGGIHQVGEKIPDHIYMQHNGLRVVFCARKNSVDEKSPPISRRIFWISWPANRFQPLLLRFEKRTIGEDLSLKRALGPSGRRGWKE